MNDTFRAQWKCRKCGAEAHSKCVALRSIFLTNQLATLIGNITEVKPGENLVSVTIHTWIGPGEHPLIAIREILKQHDDATLQQATCQHDWQIQHGECLFGCHKATEVSA